MDCKNNFISLISHTLSHPKHAGHGNYNFFYYTANNSDHKHNYFRSNLFYYSEFVSQSPKRLVLEFVPDFLRTRQ